MDHSNNYDGTFEFAFNDPSFSDRVLHIEIISGPSHDEKLKAMFGDNITKRLHDLNLHKEEEETSPDKEDVQVLRTEQIHVSSLILSSRSPFFHKLFSNGMRETDPQNKVTIKIEDAEAVALMELLHYMYAGKLSSSAKKSFVTLVDVMMLSDKYQVVSCTNHCIQMLQRLPMTPESATICLEIAFYDMVKGNTQDWADTAKKFLATRYMNVMNFKEELCNSTLPVLEAIFSDDELYVPSEDSVYDIIIKWARKQFPSLEERRAVLRSCITRLVRFPFMSPEKLRLVLMSNDLDRDFAKDLVNQALFFKVDPQSFRSSNVVVDRQLFVPRIYTQTGFRLPKGPSGDSFFY